MSRTALILIGVFVICEMMIREVSAREPPNRYPPQLESRLVERSVGEMLAQIQGDPILEKYKDGLQQDLGPEPYPGRLNVVPVKLALQVEGRPDIELDLLQDLETIKKTQLVLKEGVTYREKIYFYVQREIVAGLRYTEIIRRNGKKVDSNKLTVGSYGPKRELHIYTTPPTDAPSGMLARGLYNVDSAFSDDDKQVYLEWEWVLEIKKDWEV